MTNVTEFLGEIVAKVVRTLIERGHPGVRLQHVTAFDPATTLKLLNQEPRPRVAIANAVVSNLLKLTKYPANLLTSDLADATEWRNDPKVTGTVVIVSLALQRGLRISY